MDPPHRLFCRGQELEQVRSSPVLEQVPVRVSCRSWAEGTDLTFLGEGYLASRHPACLLRRCLGNAVTGWRPEGGIIGHGGGGGLVWGQNVFLQ